MDIESFGKKIYDGFEEIPDEAAVFLFEGEFESALQEISSSLNLKESSYQELKNELLLYIVGVRTKSEFYSFLEKLFSDHLELLLPLKEAIDEKILLPLVQSTLDVQEEPLDEAPAQTSMATPLPNIEKATPQKEDLSLIKNRLMGSTGVQLAKNDHSLPPLPKTENRPTTDDPYREHIG